MANNYWNEDEEEFRDGQNETNVDSQGMPIQAEPQHIQTQRPQQVVQPQQKAVQQPQQVDDVSYPYYGEKEDEDEDFSSVLNDARLRLEQGRLYEMILNHNLFEGSDADERAVKHVQRQIRTFAKEQMEIMLGMRQETQKTESLSVENFPFNDLEVQALKALASAATQGATKAPEAQVFTGAPSPAKQMGIRPIGLKSTAKPTVNKMQNKPLSSNPKAPVQRQQQQRVSPTVEKILQEEQVSKRELDTVFDPNHKPLGKPIHEMTVGELEARNKDIKKRTAVQAKSSSAIAMPDYDQQNMMHTMRAQAASQNPQMQTIMNLLTQQQANKPTT